MAAKTVIDYPSSVGWQMPSGDGLVASPSPDGIAVQVRQDGEACTITMPRDAFRTFLGDAYNLVAHPKE